MSCLKVSFRDILKCLYTKIYTKLSAIQTSSRNYSHNIYVHFLQTPLINVLNSIVREVWITLVDNQWRPYWGTKERVPRHSSLMSVKMKARETTYLTAGFEMFVAVASNQGCSQPLGVRDIHNERKLIYLILSCGFLVFFCNGLQTKNATVVQTWMSQLLA